MPSKLRAMCLACAVLFVTACGGGLPVIAPRVVPTAIPLPTHQPAFGGSLSSVGPATDTASPPLH